MLTAGQTPFKMTNATRAPKKTKRKFSETDADTEEMLEVPETPPPVHDTKRRRVIPETPPSPPANYRDGGNDSDSGSDSGSDSDKENQGPDKPKVIKCWVDEKMIQSGFSIQFMFPDNFSK